MVKSVVHDCRISAERAREVVMAQNRWFSLDESLRGRRGVVTSFARQCRPKIVIQVLPGTSLTPLRAVVRRHGSVRWTRFQRVRFTLPQLFGSRTPDRPLAP